MKISELIQKLQQMQESVGDLEVRSFTEKVVNGVGQYEEIDFLYVANVGSKKYPNMVVVVG